MKTNVKWPFKKVKGFIRSNEYLAFVRTLPCSACNAAPRSEAHHTEAGALSDKCDDTKTIPLCVNCHDRIHHGKETFYKENGINVKSLMFNILNTFIKIHIMNAESQTILGAHYDGHDSKR